MNPEATDTSPPAAPPAEDRGGGMDPRDSLALALGAAAGATAWLFARLDAAGFAASVSEHPAPGWLLLGAGAAACFAALLFPLRGLFALPGAIRLMSFALAIPAAAWGARAVAETLGNAPVALWMSFAPLEALAAIPLVGLGAALAYLPVRFALEHLLSRPIGALSNLLVFLVVVWIIASATFFLAKAIPGGPFTAEKRLPDSVLEALNRRYRLDDPLHLQYLKYIGDLARLDLGESYYQTGRQVREIIADRFPNSLRLGLWAMFISAGLGLPLGVWAALRQNRWQDYTALGVVVLGVSVPSFIFGTFEQYLFAYRWQLLPASGLASWKEYLMPSLALATLPGAFVIRLVRSEMIDVMGQQYIAAARARGLSATSVVWKHAIRNALLAVVTYLGPIMAGLFTGSFVIETIFDIPGLGREFVSAINNRDYNLILGTTIFYASLLVGLNMLIDGLYRVIDPRVSDAEGGAA